MARGVCAGAPIWEFQRVRDSDSTIHRDKANLGSCPKLHSHVLVVFYRSCVGLDNSPAFSIFPGPEFVFGHVRSYRRAFSTP
jgi:hypothetical protein